jgi:hypothetical protein
MQESVDLVRCIDFFKKGLILKESTIHPNFIEKTDKFENYRSSSKLIVDASARRKIFNTSPTPTPIFTRDATHYWSRMNRHPEATPDAPLTMNVHRLPSCEGPEWNINLPPVAEELMTRTPTRHHWHQHWGCCHRAPPFCRSRGKETSYLCHRGTCRS